MIFKISQLITYFFDKYFLKISSLIEKIQNNLVDLFTENKMQMTKLLRP